MPPCGLTGASISALAHPLSSLAFACTRRPVSTISAIRQGIGKTKLRSLQPTLKSLQGSGREDRPRVHRLQREGRGGFQQRTQPSGNGTSNRTDARGRERDPRRAREPTERPPRETPNPVVIAYSSPASEFLFGRSVIEAALKARRRILYKLYYAAGKGSAGTEDVEFEKLRKSAQARGVELCPLAASDSQRMLDKMSRGRPHNGYVLEASPLSRLPVKSLSSSSPATGTFALELGRQSPEEQAFNGTGSNVSYNAQKTRHPFLLFLDGVIDPGNLGAILRSAFFLGVDAVVTSSHCASLSPVVLKASAGAAEVIPMLTVHNTNAFVASSRASGWRFFAAAPSETQIKHPRKPLRTLSTLGSPLMEQPCVLMLGGEGTGLWQDLIHRADALLTIEGRRSGEAGVDSLNVSVAAALACHAFLAGTTPESNALWN